MRLQPVPQSLNYRWTDMLVPRLLSDSLGSAIASAARRIPSRRVIYGLGFAACVLLLTFAFYLEYYEGLQPCALCILQRFLVGALGIVLLVAMLHNPTRQSARRYGMLSALVAGIGAGLAGYQVWLQNLSSEVATFCLPPLSYLMTAFPLTEVFTLILQNPTSCGDIQWTFLTLSIPAWTLIAFAGLGLLGGMGQLLPDAGRRPERLAQLTQH